MQRIHVPANRTGRNLKRIHPRPAHDPSTCDCRRLIHVLDSNDTLPDHPICHHWARQTAHQWGARRRRSVIDTIDAFAAGMMNLSPASIDPEDVHDMWSIIRRWLDRHTEMPSEALRHEGRIVGLVIRQWAVRERGEGSVLEMQFRSREIASQWERAKQELQGELTSGLGLLALAAGPPAENVIGPILRRHGVPATPDNARKLISEAVPHSISRVTRDGDTGEILVTIEEYVPPPPTTGLLVETIVYRDDSVDGFSPYPAVTITGDLSVVSGKEFDAVKTVVAQHRAWVERHVGKNALATKQSQGSASRRLAMSTETAGIDYYDEAIRTADLPALRETTHKDGPVGAINAHLSLVHSRVRKQRLKAGLEPKVPGWRARARTELLRRVLAVK